MEANIQFFGLVPVDEHTCGLSPDMWHIAQLFEDPSSKMLENETNN